MNDLDRKLKRLLDLARQAPPHPPGDPAPPFLARQVVRQWQMETETSHPQVPQRSWSLAALGVIAVLILFVGQILMIRREPPQEAPSAPTASQNWAGEDLKELALLVADPPVVAVHHPQSAWLSMLTEMTEGH